MVGISGPRFLVLTGGPGAGKTSVVKELSRCFGARVVTLPESASIIYSGGFPRGSSAPLVRAAQRSIVQVQLELERLAGELHDPSSLIVCDRGICDGAAYWPSGIQSFFAETGVHRAAALARYEVVIHLRSPSITLGYDHSNPNRIETVEEARELDRRTEMAWEGHPRRRIIDATESFQEKIESVASLIEQCLAFPQTHRSSAGLSAFHT